MDASYYFMIIFGVLFGQLTNAANVEISKHDVIVIVDETEYVELQLIGTLSDATSIKFYRQHESLLDIIPSEVTFPALTPNYTTTIGLFGKSPGNLDVIANISSAVLSIDTTNIFIRVTVAISLPLIYISQVVGWIYFAAWSVSFYPQIYINFKRKSVVGLNFDFLALNFVGFFLYSIFNMGLYWNSVIEDEYFSRNPRGLNPVLINDVVFSLHAMIATSVTIWQCFVYERQEQRVSYLAKGILCLFFVLVIIFAGLAGGAVIHWLDFLYYCSYIKLTITLIKYIPQGVMNYRRKSTIGWSIGNILLDFTGGTLSMLQMILNAHNFDDYDSIFGDPTKFGLGLFSVCFDIFFMIQHYVLYRTSGYSDIPGDNTSSNLIPTEDTIPETTSETT